MAPQVPGSVAGPEGAAWGARTAGAQVYAGGSGYVTSTPAGRSTSELGLLFEADRDAGANCSSINFYLFTFWF